VADSPVVLGWADTDVSGGVGAPFDSSAGDDSSTVVASTSVAVGAPIAVVAVGVAVDAALASVGDATSPTPAADVSEVEVAAVTDEVVSSPICVIRGDPDASESDAITALDCASPDWDGLAAEAVVELVVVAAVTSLVAPIVAGVPRITAASVARLSVDAGCVVLAEVAVVGVARPPRVSDVAGVVVLAGASVASSAARDSDVAADGNEAAETRAPAPAPEEASLAAVVEADSLVSAPASADVAVSVVVALDPAVGVSVGVMPPDCVSVVVEGVAAPVVSVAVCRTRSIVERAVALAVGSVAAVWAAPDSGADDTVAAETVAVGVATAEDVSAAVATPATLDASVASATPLAVGVVPVGVDVAVVSPGEETADPVSPPSPVVALADVSVGAVSTNDSSVVAVGVAAPDESAGRVVAVDVGVVSVGVAELAVRPPPSAVVARDSDAPGVDVASVTTPRDDSRVFSVALPA
jgi:hypothetical protein